MTKKSILDIEVNDSQFQAFYQAYEKFYSHVKELPEEGRKAFSDFAVESKKLVGSSKAYSQELAKNSKAIKELQSQLNGADRTMGSMVKKSAEFSKNIFGIGKYLLKLGALGVGTVLGGGFGMGVLGNAAVSGQRQGRSLGLNQGQIRAFDTNFGRYLPSSTLGNIAGAQSDSSKRAYLALAAGVNYQQAGSQSVDQLAIQSAINAQKWWASTPQNLRTQQSLEAAGFSQIGFSMEDMRRLGNTPMSELMAARSQYKGNANQLRVSDEQTQEWYKLTRRLKLAGQTIETVLIKKLSALAPSIGNLTDSLVKDFSALISNVSQNDIKAFGSGVKNVANYLGSEQTLNNLKSFTSAVGHIADFINSWFPGARDAANKSNINSKPWAISPTEAGRNERHLGVLEHKYNLPSGLLDSLWAQESGRSNPKYLKSRAGAMGPFQLMPSTAKALGVTDPYNFSQSSQAAAQLMHENLRIYHGDLKKALAAYNMGTKALNADIAAHGSKWEQYAYPETQKHINQVLSRIKNPKVDITITNKTGANVYSSVNAAAH